MTPLFAWSRRRILFTSAGWTLLVLMMFFAGQEWLAQRVLTQLREQQRAEIEAAPLTARRAWLPPERQDLHFVAPRSTLLAVLSLALVPSILFVAVWTARRRASRAAPT